MENGYHRFLRLTNKQTISKSFKTSRKIDSAEPSDMRQKIIQEEQKKRLQHQLRSYNQSATNRKAVKTIFKGLSIDYILITFYGPVNFDLIRKFSKYGLSLVNLKAFNKIGLFEVNDNVLFDKFQEHLHQIITSPVATSYYKKVYNLLALIEKFEFFDSQHRTRSFSRDELISIEIDLAETKHKSQIDSLINYLTTEGINYSFTSQGANILRVSNTVSSEVISLITDNFDIIIGVFSTRPVRVKSSIEGPERDHGFVVTIEDDLPIVGIIDSGVEAIQPLSNLIVDGLDLTGTGYGWDDEGHGTAVAGITALGDDFTKYPSKTSYEARCKIFVIKALHNYNDSLDFHAIIKAIIDANSLYGIRLFNLSLNIDKFKKYQEPQSLFAYELDKVAHENDVLIFISTGNFDPLSLRSIIGLNDDEHSYPKFFYNPNHHSLDHSCEDTNLFSPSESMNNVSVGALAGNLDSYADNSDLTPVKEYPAFYTRKFHYDKELAKKMLGINIKMKHLNKPDLIFDGGDYDAVKSEIEVLASMSRGGFKTSSGTSLAAPFVTSYAAIILKEYPEVRSQTIKAILINNAQFLKHNQLFHFKGHKDVLKKLSGFGKPQKQYLTKTQNNGITFIVEDEIEPGSLKKTPIILPKELKNRGHKLQFDIALCYSFDPKIEDQNNYLPFDISFGIFKNMSVKEIANGVVTRQKDTNDDTPVIGIKQTISWSEDYFGFDTWLSSNSQRMTYRLQPADYQNINDEVSLVVRSFAKKDYKDKNIGLKNKFSIVIRITELCDNIVDSTLYSDILALNNTISIDQTATMDVEDLEI